MMKNDFWSRNLLWFVLLEEKQHTFNVYIILIVYNWEKYGLIRIISIEKNKN